MQVLPNKPQSLRISEMFESLQGEGPSTGTPCSFVRLAHCNLRCSWCDTPYSWNFERYTYADEVTELSLDELAGRLEPKARIVFTGGEPLLQQHALGELVRRLPEATVLEVETNGTLMPIEPLLQRIDQWNVSPKLSNSGESSTRAHNAQALAALLGSGRAWLKLVVKTAADIAEAERFMDAHAWPKARAALMPQAATRTELRERAPDVAAACATLGLRYSTRLHVELWGGRRGI